MAIERMFVQKVSTNRRNQFPRVWRLSVWRLVRRRLRGRRRSITVSPASPTWEAVTFEDQDNNFSNEAISVGAIPNSSGKATIQYETFLTGSTDVSTMVNDKITPFACSQSQVWPSLKVYNFYPYLSPTKNVRFDIGMSQVDDDNFINTTTLNQAQIQIFLQNVVTGGSFLTKFYFNNDTTFGGWYNPGGTGAPKDNVCNFRHALLSNFHDLSRSGRERHPRL